MNENRRLFAKLLDDSWKAEHWAECAVNLRRAADILFAAHAASRAEDGEPVSIEDMGMDIPATLLYGYSMENAIKGVLIKEEGVTRKNWMQVNGWQGHNLVELASRVENLKKSERRLLATLTAFVNWAGKYLVAFELEQKGNKGFILAEQYAHNEIDVCEDMPPSVFDSGSRRIADKLLDKLIARGRPKTLVGADGILRPEV